MKVSTRELKREKNKVLLKIEVPFKDTLPFIKNAYKRIRAKVIIPGFRKGHVPEKVIDSKIGKAVVYEEALREALPHFYTLALEKNKIKAIAQPEVEVIQFEEEKPLIFKAKVEVKPKFKIGNYKGIEAEKISDRVTEKEIDIKIDELREKFSNLKVVNKPLKKGYFALISFQGFVDGKPYKESSADDFLFEVGKGVLHKDFEKHLIGARKGETREFSLKASDNHHVKEIAGKEVKYKVTIKEVKEKILPELNDAFAKQVGDFKSLKELRKHLKEKLKEAKKELADLEFRYEVMKKLTDGINLEVPQVLVERQMDKMMNSFELNLKVQGVEMMDYLKRIGKEPLEYRESFRKDAEARVKNELVLEEIAEREKLKVTPEEIEKEIEKTAQYYGQDKEALKNYIEKSGNLKGLEYDILLKKALDLVIKEAKPLPKTRQSVRGKGK